MKIIKPQSANESVITVTSTATALNTLVDTAGGSRTANYYAQQGAGVVILQPEDGNIRVLLGEDPTATKGFLVGMNGVYQIPVADISDFYLISTSGDVSCSVLFGRGHDEQGLIVGSASGDSDTYDSTSQAQRVLSTNPDYEHNQSNPHLVDVSNIADTTTHYAYIDTRTYKNGFLQGIFGGTDTITVKVSASGETDVAITSATYVDVSNDILGATSKTADFGAYLDSQMVAPYLRVEYTSNNTSSDGDLKITFNQVY